MINKKIIAVDFDGVVAEQLYPYKGKKIGNEIEGASYYINKLYDEGYYIIIWTCRGDEGLVAVHEWLVKKKIKFHKINENADMHILGFKPLPKIFYNCLVDDRNAFGFQGWEKTYNWIKENIV